MFLSALQRTFVVLSVCATVLALLLSSVPSCLAARGGLDLGFGTAGKVKTDFFGGSDIANAMVLQPDGKVVVAGTCIGPSHGFDFAIARYDTNGTLDLGFGSGGKTSTDFGSTLDEAFAVALQSDGKIIAAGIANGGCGLARYNADGSLDSTFGLDGKVSTSAFGAFSVAIQSDGKLVAVGTGADPITQVPGFGITRYNTDGSLDSGFGIGGHVTTDFFGTFAEAFAVAIQSDGKIVAVGEAFGATTDFAVARYNTDGNLDSTFGIGGKVNTDFGGSESAFAVTLLFTGKIVAAGGGHRLGTTEDFTIARYNSDGTLDSTFGSTGKTSTDFFGSTDVATAVAALPDGSIVVAGRAADQVSGFTFALASYSIDGSPDPGFGSAGKVTTDLFVGADWANSVAVQSDGKIVIAGHNEFSDFALARYDNNSVSFDVCVQDDVTGNLFKFNSATGDYLFIECRGKTTISGKGKTSRSNCAFELTEVKSDRRVEARLNRCEFKGFANLRLSLSQTPFTVTDSDTRKSDCICH